MKVTREQARAALSAPGAAYSQQLIDQDGRPLTGPYAGQAYSEAGSPIGAMVERQMVRFDEAVANDANGMSCILTKAMAFYIAWGIKFSVRLAVMTSSAHGVPTTEYTAREAESVLFADADVWPLLINITGSNSWSSAKMPSRPVGTAPLVACICDHVIGGLRGCGTCARSCERKHS